MARAREKAFAGDPKPALTRFPVLATIALGDRPRRDCGDGEQEMRNSQYFGLLWVLTSIAAAVVASGLIGGIFILCAVVSAGLANHQGHRQTPLKR